MDWAFEARQDLIDAALSDLDQPDYESEVRAITKAAYAAAPHGVVPTDPNALSDQIEQHVFVYSLPWMRYFISYDPAPALRDLSVLGRPLKNVRAIGSRQRPQVPDRSLALVCHSAHRSARPARQSTPTRSSPG